MSYEERAALLFHETLHGALGSTRNGMWDTTIQEKLGFTGEQVSATRTSNITRRIADDCFKPKQ